MIVIVLIVRYYVFIVYLCHMDKRVKYTALHFFCFSLFFPPMFSFFYFSFPPFISIFPFVSPPQAPVALSVRTRPQLRAELANHAGSSQPAGHRRSSAPHPQPQLMSRPCRLRSTLPSPPQVFPCVSPQGHLPHPLCSCAEEGCPR
jgi:hypothetical protein